MRVQLRWDNIVAGEGNIPIDQLRRTDTTVISLDPRAPACQLDDHMVEMLIEQIREHRHLFFDSTRLEVVISEH